MAWTVAKQTRPASTRYAVYSEVAVDDSDKTFTVATDAGLNFVLRPHFIEILYTATAIVGTRTLKMIMSNGGVDVMTMLFDTNTDPVASDTKRILLYPERSDIEVSVTTDVHVHTMMPIVLGQGDSLRIFDAAAIDVTPPADLLVIHMHVEVLSDGS